MLSPDQNPGLFTVVIGFIALVFVGVGLSVVRDKRAKSGKQPSLIRLIADNNTEIGNLKEEIVIQQLHHGRLLDKSAKDTARSAEIARELGKVEEAHTSLAANRDALRSVVSDLELDLKELRNRPTTPRPQAPAPVPAPPQANPELEQARAAVRTATQRVDILGSQLAEAQRNIAAGTINVPGSLKTWKEVEANLQKSLAAARVALEQARTNLSRIPPLAPGP